jgi:hypothetical protein
MLLIRRTAEYFSGLRQPDHFTLEIWLLLVLLALCVFAAVVLEQKRRTWVRREFDVLESLEKQGLQ